MVFILWLSHTNSPVIGPESSSSSFFVFSTEFGMIFKLGSKNEVRRCESIQTLSLTLCRQKFRFLGSAGRTTPTGGSWWRGRQRMGEAQGPIRSRGGDA